MEFLTNMFEGVPGAWSGGIAHCMIVISLVIALGKILGGTKIFGISFGVTWVLFVGIVFGHFGLTLHHDLLHFLKEFGLILFVYSIGMQVGPGFFSSFRSGGLALNGLAMSVIAMGVITTIILHFVTGTDMETMVGVMSGAVTNTPGLGAAQQAYFDVTGQAANNIALGYAVAYPLGVIGCITAFILIKKLCYAKAPVKKQEAAANVEKIDIAGDDKKEKKSEEAKGYISRKILISKPKLNGKKLSSLNFPENLGATVVRINRAGVEINATPNTRLQYGDFVKVVGSAEAVAAVEKVLGNSLKRLDHPNLIPIFIGIALGCILGSIPVMFPGIPQPVKLGLAGGPLIVSILISHFGPRFKVVTYATTSANLMIREIGIALFLACVGLQAGDGFIETIVHGGGLKWILYGACITMIPVFLGGVIGRVFLKLDYNTLIGVLSGCSTNPPALAYAGEQDRNSDAPAVGYATVYPLAMFLRVLAAQLMILFFIAG